MARYNHVEIEKKWQDIWAKTDVYVTEEDSDKPKFYCLDMFPYPSGAGLHVGHPKGYIATDVFSRFKKLEGYKILHPMGWDAFGLPAENYAIKNKVHPSVAVEKNIKMFKEQLGKIGFNYDWSREINTTDPEYYKWTQWTFVQMFKKGLAYQSWEPINWCPSCKTGLSMEDLEDGKCERCGGEVEQKPMRQWVLAITKYADRLLEDLKLLDWEEQIIEQQRNWIGRKEGITIHYPVVGHEKLLIDTFTTRPDTNFGSTFVVLAPEHDIVAKLLSGEIKEVEGDLDAIKTYVEKTKKKTELERIADARKKTGVFTGLYVLNRLTNKKLPVWISDFVLGHFGTGAVVGVPGHDMRDFEFAKVFDIPIIRVVVGKDGDKSDISEVSQVQEEEGTMINSGFLDGLDIHVATKKIMDYLEEKGWGDKTVTYRMKDWVFSRQRYWGEPTPIVHCEKCGAVAVPEEQLPVVLPEVSSYEPTGTGESPLAAITEWVNTTCPECGGPAKRETDTMPQWAGSSWYYLRYIDPKNDSALVDPKEEKEWMPVDLYVGGIEHATRHLLYARFWHKFLYDIKTVSTVEPFKKLIHVGLILAEDGRKMSKRWANVINPDDIVAEYGADSLRLYEMFMGPFTQYIAWNTQGVKGVRRFLEKVWDYAGETNWPEISTSETAVRVNKLIKKVTSDIEDFKFNTAIASFMEFMNYLAENKGTISKLDFEKFVVLLSPFTPHISEEIWERFDNTDSICVSKWPTFDEKLTQDETVTVAIQINGKVRDNVLIDAGASEEDVKKLALASEKVQKYLEGKEIIKTIYVKDKLLSIVLK